MRFRYTLFIVLTLCFVVIFQTTVFSDKTGNSNEQDLNNIPAAEATKSNDRKTGPRIQFDTTVQNLGEVAPSSRTNCEFKFTNTGDATLKIRKIDKTCGCTATKLSKKEYAPGESGTLQITYHASSMPANVHKKVYVSSNDKRHPKVTLDIKCKIVLKIDYEPQKLQLKVRKDNTTCPEITLKSKDGKPFSITRFMATSQSINADFDASVKKTNHVIKPTINGETISKLKRGQITINTNHPGCKYVRIPFEIIPEFKTKPAGLTLLDVKPEEPITRELWVLSNYDEDFEIESVTSQKGYAKATNQEKNGNRYKIDLEITPPDLTSSKRMFQDKIMVKIKDKENLEVNCFGIYPRKK